MAPPRARPIHMPSPHTLAFARFGDALAWPASAILASGIIAASGRPYCVADAIAVATDAHSTLKLDQAQGRQTKANALQPR